MKNFCSLCWRSVRTLERVGAFFVSTTVFWVGVTLAIVVLSFSLLAFTPSCGLGAIGRKRVVFNILLFKNAFSAAMACNFCFEKNASAQSLSLSLSLSLSISRRQCYFILPDPIEFNNFGYCLPERKPKNKPKITNDDEREVCVKDLFSSCRLSKSVRFSVFGFGRVESTQ